MFDLTNLNNAFIAQTKEEKTYIKYCKQYGLPANLLHKNITNIITNKTYEIVGMNKKGKFASIICTDHQSPIDMSIDIIKVLNPKIYQLESI